MADFKINGKNVVTQSGSAEPVLASNVTIAGAAALQGVSYASQWRQNAATTTNNTYFTTNWEAATASAEDSPGVIGSPMTESGGVFTFPVTGIWLIQFRVTANASSGSCSYNIGRIDVCTNGSTFTEGAVSYSSIYTSGAYMSMHMDFIFDCTSTSTHKCRFSLQSANNVDIGAANWANKTAATFIKLGNT